jgi:hypothetical protein
MEIGPLSRVVRRFAGELTTIVLGILCALWIGEAAADRADRRLEADYLGSLEEDLVADSAAIAVALSAAERQEVSAKAVLDTLSSGVQPSPSFLMQLFAAGDVRQFEPQQVTLEELRATGNLRLLQDRELLRRLIKYYSVARLTPSDETMRSRAVTRYLDLAESVLGAGGLGNPTLIRSMLEGNKGFTLAWYPPPFPIGELRALRGFDGAVQGVQVLAAGDKERLERLTSENGELLSMLRRRHSKP